MITAGQGSQAEIAINHLIISMYYGSGLTECCLGKFTQAANAFGQIVKIHEQIIVGHILGNLKGFVEQTFAVKEINQF